MVHFPDGLPPVLPITIAQVRRRLPEGTEVVLGAGNRVAPGDIVARPPAAAPLVAGIRGYIAGVRPGREMLIETGAAVVRCPLGLGGEAYGMLRLIGERDQILSEASVDARSAGAIVAGGSATAAALRKARNERVLGVVLGSLDAGELAAFLECGPDALAAAAPRYAGPPGLLITGGFGAVAMDEAVWNLLRTYDRHEVLLDAAGTPARLVVPLPRLPGGVAPMPPTEARPGMRVRLVDEPHLGMIGTLVAVHQQARFPAGVRGPAATVRLGERDVTVALAAVEVLMEL